MTPKQQRLNFRFTIFEGAITALDLRMFLTQIHHYYGGKVMILWDGLPAHIATQMYFERERPDWFLFEYFPGYSPELNPVEQCWNMMKNVFLANFVPMSLEHLREKTLEVAKRLNNDPKLLAEFFHHAKLNL
jgi:transposase